MSRAAEQFRNFARFDPSLPPPDDDTLARLVRRVTGRGAWRSPLPPEKRVVIPGYADLRSLSEARALIVQENIGLGWTAYIRVGNWRMFPAFLNGPTQQRHTQERLEGCIARNDLFIGYLTTYPSLSVNHAIVIYGRRPATAADTSARSDPLPRLRPEPSGCAARHGLRHCTNANSPTRRTGISSVAT